MKGPATAAGPYELDIHGTGVINGTDFSATGQGSGDTRTGDLDFDVSFSALAQDTDPIANLLAVLILPTGAFGQEIDGAVNLLSLGGGDFRFRQVLSGEGITAESSGTLTRSEGNSFAWASEAAGEVRLRNVTAIEPVEVIMIPAGLGRLIETIDWIVVDEGAVRRFQAVRHFTFAPTRELPDLQLRTVRITPQASGRRVHLSINSRIRAFTRDRRSEA